MAPPGMPYSQEPIQGRETSASFQLLPFCPVAATFSERLLRGFHPLFFTKFCVF